MKIPVSQQTVELFMRENGFVRASFESALKLSALTIDLSGDPATGTGQEDGRVSPQERIDDSMTSGSAARSPCTCGERDHLETDRDGTRASTATSEKERDRLAAQLTKVERQVNALRDALLKIIATEPSRTPVLSQKKMFDLACDVLSDQAEES